MSVEELEYFIKIHGEPDWNTRGTEYLDGYDILYGWNDDRGDYRCIVRYYYY